MQALMAYDKGLLESFRRLTGELETGLVRYKGSLGELERLQSQQKEELTVREKTLKSRKNLVSRLRKDKREVQKSIAKLEDDAKEISGILETLELERERTLADSTLPGLADRQGNLVWPIKGRIIRPFGQMRDKRGIVLSNPGIDIQANMGADVLSAASGVIAYVNWLRGYGQFIIIDHGRGFYTLYANLSDILVEPGERVAAGELVGFAGDSGSLEGPKLHFEVRHKKDQLNPTDWLR
jgi:septal ring factor EnvC (AmiA/AmiB activator)